VNNLPTAKQIREQFLVDSFKRNAPVSKGASEKYLLATAKQTADRDMRYLIINETKRISNSG